MRDCAPKEEKEEEEEEEDRRLFPSISMMHLSPPKKEGKEKTSRRRCLEASKAQDKLSLPAMFIAVFSWRAKHKLKDLEVIPTEFTTEFTIEFTTEFTIEFITEIIAEFTTEFTTEFITEFVYEFLLYIVCLNWIKGSGSIM